MRIIEKLAVATRKTNDKVIKNLSDLAAAAGMCRDKRQKAVNTMPSKELLDTSVSECASTNCSTV